MLRRGRDLRDDERVAAEGARGVDLGEPPHAVERRHDDRDRRDGHEDGQHAQAGAQRVRPQRGNALPDGLAQLGTNPLVAHA